MTQSPFVKSFDWLQERLEDPTIKVVDASWYLPTQNRDGQAEFVASHIPGAVFFDHDEIADHTSGLPHTIPSPEQFAEQVGALGLSETDTIIIYDGPGMFTAPRAWWLLRSFGAENVFVLDGGFDQWLAEGRPVEKGPAKPESATFHARMENGTKLTFDDMRAVVANGTMQIADARGPGRFTGTEPEPRDGMRSGHMPGALNVPFGILSDGGHLKSVDDLRTTLEEAGLDLSRPVATTCGSGVTAAVITLALHSVGHVDNRLYDGSWSEWGGRDDTPVVTG